MILGFIKIKENKNARQLALECIEKVQKQTLFGLDDEVPFALKYMRTVALYSESNSKYRQQALIEHYKLLRDNSNFDNKIKIDEY